MDRRSQGRCLQSSSGKYFPRSAWTSQTHRRKVEPVDFAGQPETVQPDAQTVHRADSTVRKDAGHGFGEHGYWQGFDRNATECTRAGMVSKGWYPCRYPRIGPLPNRRLPVWLPERLPRKRGRSWLPRLRLTGWLPKTPHQTEVLGSAALTRWGNSPFGRKTFPSRARLRT